MRHWRRDRLQVTTYKIVHWVTSLLSTEHCLLHTVLGFGEEDAFTTKPSLAWCTPYIPSTQRAEASLEYISSLSKKGKNWRDGSVVKSTGCSLEGPGSIPTQQLTTICNSSSRELMPSHRHTYRETPMHIK